MDSLDCWDIETIGAWWEARDSESGEGGVQGAQAEVPAGGHWQKSL
jgi:hypothetical protein